MGKKKKQQVVRTLARSHHTHYRNSVIYYIMKST